MNWNLRSIPLFSQNENWKQRLRQEYFEWILSVSVFFRNLGWTSIYLSQLVSSFLEARRLESNQISQVMIIDRPLWVSGVRDLLPRLDKRHKGQHCTDNHFWGSWYATKKHDNCIVTVWILIPELKIWLNSMCDCRWCWILVLDAAEFWANGECCEFYCSADARLLVSQWISRPTVSALTKIRISLFFKWMLIFFSVLRQPPEKWICFDLFWANAEFCFELKLRCCHVKDALF